MDIAHALPVPLHLPDRERRFILRHLEPDVVTAIGPDEPVEITVVHPALLHRHGPEQGRRREQHRGREDPVAEAQTAAAEEILAQRLVRTRTAARPDHLPALTPGDEPTSDDGARVRRGLRRFQLSLELPWEPGVVVVEECRPVGAGESDSGIECGPLAAAHRAHVHPQPRIVDGSERSLRRHVRPVEHHDHLEVAERLGQHALHRRDHQMRPVDGGDDHRDARAHDPTPLGG